MKKIQKIDILFFIFIITFFIWFKYIKNSIFIENKIYTIKKYEKKLKNDIKELKNDNKVIDKDYKKLKFYKDNKDKFIRLKFNIENSIYNQFNNIFFDIYNLYYDILSYLSFNNNIYYDSTIFCSGKKEYTINITLYINNYLTINQVIIQLNNYLKKSKYDKEKVKYKIFIENDKQKLKKIIDFKKDYKKFKKYLLRIVIKDEK